MVYFSETAEVKGSFTLDVAPCETATQRTTPSESEVILNLVNVRLKVPLHCFVRSIFLVCFAHFLENIQSRRNDVVH